MRPLRFLAREPMAMVVLIVAALLGLILVSSSRQIGHGVGHRDTQLSFVVSDADSGQPIDGATISLRDPDSDSNPILPYMAELKSDRHGKVSMPLSLQFVNKFNPVSGEL